MDQERWKMSTDPAELRETKKGPQKIKQMLISAALHRRANTQVGGSAGETLRNL